ncbi:MAG: NUDIX hydrolase [Acidobacteriales bacterium 59-55]|nr:MAG: NUDIX hydrolase [Acidobacteriales bacterium 59-55]
MSTKRSPAAKPKAPSQAVFGKPKTSAKKKTSATKATVLSSKLAYDGKVFSIFTEKVIEPGSTEPRTRDVIHHNGSIVVLAVDESRNPKDPDIILIRQYRHAVGQFLLELPAGRIEPREAPLAAAKREMIEETGFRARRWTVLTKYFASPGFLGESMQIYLARDLREGAANPEEDEHIEIVRTPLSQALSLIAANKIHDGKTLIGVSLYAAARREGRL